MLAIAERRARSKAETFSIVPAGTDGSFRFISQHFVLGYFFTESLRDKSSTSDPNSQVNAYMCSPRMKR